MAKIVLNEQEIDVPDGEKIVEHIEEAGVPIGCSNGVCGTCEVEILEGMENLNEVTEEEEDLGMEGNKRLGCQCKIKSGTVTLEY
ncbi:(2Fe-2S)-binding protein [bacterium]|jgi:ferredoxin|nr:(2Fe-2S)-binding protein [bacterium]